MKHKQAPLEVTCRKCGYVWSPRKANPVEIKRCPNQECQAWMPLQKKGGK